MKKMYITNPDNTKLEVDVIRYVKFKNDYYFIYTLHEIDEKGYIKLYLVEIMEELGETISQNIKNDSKWANMKGIVKKIIKEIKSGKRKLSHDLDFRDIENVKVSNPRFFKLDKNLVTVLSSNYLEDLSIQEENIKENIQDTIEPILPIQNEPTYSKQSEDSIPPIFTNQPVHVEESISQESLPMLQSEPSKNIGLPILRLEKGKESLNYEELYNQAIKAKEATNSMLLNTLKQLQKYKNKYGKLED